MKIRLACAVYKRNENKRLPFASVYRLPFRTQEDERTFTDFVVYTMNEIAETITRKFIRERRGKKINCENKEIAMQNTKTRTNDIDNGVNDVLANGTSSSINDYVCQTK